MTCCAYSCTQYGLHTQYMLLTHADDCCAYSYTHTQYGLNRQYMFLTYADDLLCLQLHTVQSNFFHTFKIYISPSF